MARGKTIWVTRAEPGASATAARLAILGHEAIVEPLFELQKLESPLPLEGVSALAFTSANGVRAFAERSTVRTLRVFAVGDATSQAAREAGFRTVLSTRGDVGALAAGIRARKRELAGSPVLHPGARERAGDLAGALAEDGIEVISAPLYAAVPRRLGDELMSRLPQIGAVLLHSPNGSRALARFLRKSPAPKMAALCISKQTARPLSRAVGAGRLASLSAATLPNEDALLNLIEAI